MAAARGTKLASLPGIAGSLRGPQDLSDEGLGLATTPIADAAKPDVEVVVAGRHRHHSAEIRRGAVPREALKSLEFSHRAARHPTDAPGERQAMSMAWRSTGEPLLSCR